MITRLEKHLILALVCLGWTVVLVALTIRQLGGTIPPRPDLPDSAIPRSYKAVKTAPIINLISSTVYTRLKPAVNQTNPFYCIQLFPPKPPPPKTRKVEVLYQGFFMTSHGEKHAYILAAGKLMVGMVGTKVVSHLVIADINQAGITLKDDAGKEVYLPFNEQQNLEVPAS